MKSRLNKFCHCLYVSCRTMLAGVLAVFLWSNLAAAQEITAIDFNGDMLGKVIPDGNVVGFDNRLIGNVTADSLILNFDGALIGGVVPQGIAIGNDTAFLGKVNNDGSVRLPSGKIIGKVLPNGLVVNDYYEILGAVLFPGLIYDDNGLTVGRLTGDGMYTNLKGQSIGFVTPDGYAYRKVGTDFLLDGRLISSKMVISVSGEFLGSVVPGGEVSNFDGKIIGRVKANGFVYNDRNAIIGRIVKSSYAFDNYGRYLGFVTYNGEVLNNSKVVGKYRADGSIIDKEANVIGFAVDFAATATNLQGKYIGRLLPNGILAKAKDVVAQLGARGDVIDADGKIIGRTIKNGPVFDYRAALSAHALSNGQVISLSGNGIGKIIDNQAYSLQGRILGATLEPKLIVNSNNSIGGVSGINASFKEEESTKLVSPYGYVLSADGAFAGMSRDFAPIYNAMGAKIAQISLDGKVISLGNSVLGTLTQSGLVVDERNLILGKTIDNNYAVNSSGDIFGELASNNLIIDKNKAIVAKITPDNAVIPTTTENSVSLMPKTGSAFKQNIAIDFDGMLQGYVDISGLVKDFDGTNIGRVVDNSYILDNNNIISGYVIGSSVTVNDKCELTGMVTPRGDVRNFKDIYIGRALANGQVIDETGNSVAMSVSEAPVVDFNGNIIASTGGNGQILDYKGAILGCLNKKGQVRNSNGEIIARALEYAPVIDFKDTILGRTNIDGTVIGNDSQVLGYVQPDNNVNSRTGAPLGNLFKYTIAFDNNNLYMGRVLPDTRVVNEKSEEVGKVAFDGSVSKNNQKVGYALYDFYIYNDEYNVIGLIGKNGQARSFNNKNLGNLTRGFILTNDESIVARGNRDYYIRDSGNLILGELLLNGEVRNSAGQLVGKLSSAGQVTDDGGNVLATAKPLQYYSRLSASAELKEVVVDDKGNVIGHVEPDGRVINEKGEVIGYKDSSGNIVDKLGSIIGRIFKGDKVYDETGKLVGFANPDGSVVDENGKLIGKLNENGTVTNANNAIIGGIGTDWYEKVESRQPRPQTGPDLPTDTKPIEGDKYRKSLNIALTPDGNYLGDILDDGSVVDKGGKVLGHKTPDGLIIDSSGTLIGIEEVKKVDGAKDIFVPAGTFGEGSAYGTGAGAGDNLGPGGGFGPGERYDPQRGAALTVAQGERRQNMQVGKISSSVRKEAFDGMQKDWEEQGIAKSISSWRVNMSEMILADKPIPAVLSRAIDSNNATPVTAVVERNVFAEEGRNIIIPAGSRLIGEFGGLSPSSEASSEAAKVQITWQRLIRPDGSIFVFDGLTADAQGRGGALGYLDKQLFKRYSMPVLTSILTNSMAYMMAPSEEETGGETETPKQEAANDARQNFLDQMNQLFEKILQDKADITPMAYVPAGTRIIVFPKTDLWVRTIERDSEKPYNSLNAEVLIDEPGRSQQESQGGAGRTGNATTGTGGASETGGKVTYQPDDAGAEPNSLPLFAEGNTQKTKPKTPIVVPPPPPSSAGTGSSAARKPSGSGASNGSGSSSDSGSGNGSVPQLF